MQQNLPARFGRYVLQKRIAVGGMAEVFSATYDVDGFKKRVCIKRILPHLAHDADFVRMFREEAQFVAKLSHNNLVQVFDFGEEGGNLYLAMEYVEGTDLASLVKHLRTQKRPFSVTEVLTVGREVCAALHCAHNAVDGDGTALNLVHRDVSPHNILLSKDGGIKLIDFGIAMGAGRETRTETGVLKGKVRYMSPEQALADRALDHRSDQFAVAVVLWEMLTGVHLLARGKPEHLALVQLTTGQTQEGFLGFRSDVPPKVESAILKALHPDREQRYENMRQLQLVLTKELFLADDLDDEIDLGALVREVAGEPEGSGAYLASVRMPEKTELLEGSQSLASAAGFYSQDGPIEKGLDEDTTLEDDDGGDSTADFEASGEEEASAYGSASAIFRTAASVKYADAIAELVAAHPYRDFSDLAERFPLLAAQNGTRPFDPFQLLASTSGLSPQTFDDESWAPSEQLGSDPAFCAARFLVNTYMNGRPAPVSAQIKSIWDTAQKIAYLSVFEHHRQQQKEHSTDARYDFDDLISEFQQIQKARMRAENG